MRGVAYASDENDEWVMTGEGWNDSTVSSSTSTTSTAGRVASSTIATLDKFNDHHLTTGSSYHDDDALWDELMEIPNSPNDLEFFTAASPIQHQEKYLYDNNSNLVSGKSVVQCDYVATSPHVQHERMYQIPPTPPKKGGVECAKMSHRKKSARGSNQGSELPSRRLLSNSESSSSPNWEKWDNLNNLLDGEKSLTELQVEQRRQRNRDAMQRSRRKKRERLEMLKTTVSQLEQQYAALCLDSTESSNSSFQQIVTAGYGAKVTEAMNAIKQLSAEKFYLEAAVRDQTSWKSRLQEILESMPYLDPVAPNTTVLSFNPLAAGHKEAASMFRFSPVLSEEDVRDMILENRNEIRRIHNRMMTADPKTLMDHVHVLGWNVMRRSLGKEVEFMFIKRFRNNVSVYDVMEKTWGIHKQLKPLQKIDVATRRLDVLQQVSDNAVVLGRDIFSEDDRCVFRTVFLQYRMETATELIDPENPWGPKLPASGYWIGFHSLNPVDHPSAPPLGLEANEIMFCAELTVGIEILNVRNPMTGETFVELRWTGRTNYQSEQHVHRSMTDTLSTLLRWELGTVAPALNLVTSLSTTDAPST